MKPERRNTYSTRRSLKSNDITSLDDVIEMGEIGEDVPVSEIIDTERGLLCYVYDD
jgi:tyrosinase